MLLKKKLRFQVLRDRFFRNLSCKIMSRTEFLTNQLVIGSQYYYYFFSLVYEVGVGGSLLIAKKQPPDKILPARVCLQTPSIIGACRPGYTRTLPRLFRINAYSYHKDRTRRHVVTNHGQKNAFMMRDRDWRGAEKEGRSAVQGCSACSPIHK